MNKKQQISRAKVKTKLVGLPQGGKWSGSEFVTRLSINIPSQLGTYHLVYI